MVKFKDFSRPLSVFQVLFKANLTFKDSVYSSTIQVCVSPVKLAAFQLYSEHAFSIRVVNSVDPFNQSGKQCIS